MKLRQKMFLIYTVIAIIPVLSIGYYSYERWYQSVTEQVHTYSETLISNAVDQSNGTLDSVNRAINFMTVYSNSEDVSLISILEQFANQESPSAYELLQANRKADAIFSSLIYTNEYLKGAYLITTKSLILGTSNDQTSKINKSHDCRNDRWYLETLKLNGKYFISTFTSDDLFTDKNSSIYLARCVFDVYTHDYLGIILLDLDPAILNLDNLITLPDMALLYISNPQTGEVLYSNVDTLSDSNPHYTDNLQTKDLSLSPLEMTISFRYSTLYDQYNPTRAVILAMIFVFIAGELISLYLVTKNLTFPIERLSRVMSMQRKNKLKFISPYKKRKDEIGTLYNEYSNMLDEINESIQKEYKNRLIALDSQMKALEARINSHFLFNTLESINSMAELSDNQGIATMSLALGNMFRYAIKTKSELVTLGDELRHVDDYVSIQTIRFNGRFHLEKEIPDELKEQPVLKLILQPLVENSLYHGLNYCTSGDTIAITADRKDSLLLVTVSDNGIGMDEATLTKLRGRLAEDASFTELGRRSEKSIGLKNIQTRIQLYYGEQYGLTIESQKNNGTQITIAIPLQKPVIIRKET